MINEAYIEAELLALRTALTTFIAQSGRKSDFLSAFQTNMRTFRELGLATTHSDEFLQGLHVAERRFVQVLGEQPPLK